MTKRIQSKYSVCKKLHNFYKNLWGLKTKDNYRSLKQKKKKITSFGKILNIKQSFKLFYSNINESSFKNIIMYSIKSRSKTLDKLVSILESRIDSLLFRSCLATSFHEARLLIIHKHITVNNLCIKSPNLCLTKGDVIKINNIFLKKSFFFNILHSRSLPNYLELDFKNLAFVFLWDPNFRNAYYPVNVDYTKIIRYYK
jgi:small subunit ribosomal protein S4